VNSRVDSNDVVQPFETSYREAIDKYHAKAFFEEKYGDVVRVVGIGDYSFELCGGTHVPRTGHIGFVKVLGEGSIGSNIRRVEALTGAEGLRWVNTRLAERERAAEMIKVPPDELLQGIERLVRTQKELEKQLDAQQRSGVAAAVDELVAQASELGKGKLLVAKHEGDANTLRQLAASLRDKLGSSVVILGTSANGSANVVVATTKSLGVNAVDIARSAGPHIGGGGGGKPDLAMAGGSKPDGLDAALATARAEAERLLA
jgi:alanyl-tRNA synthetase